MKLNTLFVRFLSVTFLFLSSLSCGDGAVATFTIGGTLTGLAGTVVLQNNAADDLTLTEDGSFTFATSLADGETYQVTVSTQPEGSICTISGGEGTISGGNVANVSIVCSEDTYTVGGTLSGLSGTVVLQNNSGDNLTLTDDGGFTFATKIADGSSYVVTVLTNPDSPVHQTCTASNNSGTMNGADVTSVSIVCSVNSYTVGGTVAGLTGTVVLQNNAGDNLSLSANGSFTFATHVADTAGYAVSVLTQPVEQSCVVGNASGTIDAGNVTDVTVTCTNGNASITVSDSPLTLTTNGPTGTLTINNTSLTVTATNITSDFTGTVFDGNVVETGNTCNSLAPQASCTLTYTPGSTVVSQTDFPIVGSNTNTVTAAIAIDASVTLVSANPSSGSAAGGTGFTLTGTNLTGATGVTFGGAAATSINVVNATTVTGVSPAHAAGAVDVDITTPEGSATLTDGYTYVATSVGQSSFGGTIACLNGGLNDLIAASADISTSIIWGGFGVVTSATSITDGATNSATIITTLGANGGTPYAAQLCGDYEVDSQGNLPCEAGNTCYNDWFVPAGNNVTASGQLNCLYTNKVAIGGFGDFYWSSTEVDANNAWFQDFTNGAQGAAIKASTIRVRCVRSFTP